MLDAGRIATLLQPFLPDVSTELAAQLQTYLDLLLRWNARMNLTAIRDPEQIVARHFGESLFAAAALRDFGALASAASLVDLGSGAGFPGIPIKLVTPELRLTLVESQNKKATFLREAVRALGLSHIVVHGGRAENWDAHASIVTLRAVEKFERTLPVAAGLVAQAGTLCLLIGDSQVQAASSALSGQWAPPVIRTVPNSQGRIVWLARRQPSV